MGIILTKRYALQNYKCWLKLQGHASFQGTGKLMEVELEQEVIQQVEVVPEPPSPQRIRWEYWDDRWRRWRPMFADMQLFLERRLNSTNFPSTGVLWQCQDTCCQDKPTCRRYWVNIGENWQECTSFPWTRREIRRSVI